MQTPPLIAEILRELTATQLSRELMREAWMHV